MTITVKPVHSIPAPVIRVSLVSAILFPILLTTLLILQPEIDPRWRFVSEHALGRHGWMMSMAFLAMAASSVATALALWSQLQVGGRIGVGFLFIGALGLALAATFRTDPITTPLDAQSTSSQLHGLGAILSDGVAFGATLITGSLFRNPSWRSARGPLIVMLVIIWILYVWIIMSMPVDGQFGPDVPIGWPSHLYLVSYSLWFIVTAWQALRLRKQIS
jgi:hypothetical protein